MQGLEDFRIFYNHTIHPELLRLDRKRRRLLRLLFFSSLLLIGIIIFELFLNILVVTLVLMIPITIYITYLFYQVQKFRKTFKPKIVNLILEFMKDSLNFRRLNYHPEKYLPIGMFLGSEIFGARPAVYQGEDFIEGRIDEVDFEMCELNVREFSRVRSRLNYVFRGVFLHAKLKSKLPGSILILPRKFRQYLTRSLKAANTKGAKKIDNFLKNRAFREIFMTYATTNVKVGEILPEYLQEVFAEYVMKTGKDIYLSFKGEHLFIAVTNHKDILEPFIFQSNVSFDLVKEFFEDIHLVINIVEEFDAHY